MMGRVESYY